jgi:hypothetical protein
VVRVLVPVVAVPAQVELVVAPVVASADRALAAVEPAAVADSRPAVAPVEVLVALRELVPARPVVAVPVAALAAVPAVVRVDSVVGDVPADPRNGAGRSVVVTAPSSSRLRSDSRPPMHPSPKGRSSSRAAALFRSTRPS